MNTSLAEALVDTLPTRCPGLFNPWRDRCELDVTGSPEAGPEGRLVRLAEHLDCTPRFILVGEAPGWLAAGSAAWPLRASGS